MSEEMQTEIEKRIEEVTIEIEKQAFLTSPYKETDLSDAFRAGAKFILEMPELREAIQVCDDVVEINDDDDCYFDHHGYCQAHNLQKDCYVAKAKRILEFFKKAGLV